MSMKSSRALAAMKPVLKDPNSTGPDPLYEVWEAPENLDGWVNNTRLKPGLVGEEYPKTFGHYHPTDAPVETYKIVEGQGVFVLQKKTDQEDRVEEVLLVKFKEGDVIKLTKEWGHSMSNTGSLELSTYDNWSHGHTPSDYQPIQDLQGMSYYLVDNGGEVQSVKNEKYKDLPEAVWLTAEEFSQDRG